MGMYDRLTCAYPIPLHPDIAELVDTTKMDFQTKDLECDLDDYEIREDGTLWRQDYDTEDRSDPNAVGFMRFCGCATRVNKRWVPCTDVTGEVCGYDSIGPDRQGWLEFSAYFVKGEIKSMNVVESRLTRLQVTPRDESTTD